VDMVEEEELGEQILVENLPSHARLCINVFLITATSSNRQVKSSLIQ
jgi:hypothetical protein